jgi:hypothetical protein
MPKNPLQEAVEGAAPEHVAELLAPFNTGKTKFNTFGSLLKHVQALRSRDEDRKQVEEAQELENAQQESRTQLVKDFAKVGIKLEAKDPRVSACLKLEESEQPAFIKACILPKMISSGGKQNQIKAELNEAAQGEDGNLTETDRAEVRELFPSPVGTKK